MKCPRVLIADFGHMSIIPNMFVKFADKTRGSITFQKEVSRDVHQIANTVLNKILYSSTVHRSSDFGSGCSKLLFYCVHLSFVMLCVIWYYLCNWKTWKALMEECYFKWSCKLKHFGFPHWYFKWSVPPPPPTYPNFWNTALIWGRNSKLW